MVWNFFMHPSIRSMETISTELSWLTWWGLERQSNQWLSSGWCSKLASSQKWRGREKRLSSLHPASFITGRRRFTSGLAKGSIFWFVKVKRNIFCNKSISSYSTTSTISWLFLMTPSGYMARLWSISLTFSSVMRATKSRTEISSKPRL